MKRLWRLSLYCCLIISPLSAQRLQWTNFHLPDYLIDARPKVLFESSDGLIWLATSMGLSAFDGNSFTDLVSTGSLEVAPQAMFEDSNGIIWIGYTDGSVNQLVNGKLISWTPEEGHPAARITGFTEDEAGRIWLSTYGEGVYLIDGHYMYNFNTDDGITGNDIYTITSQSNGEVWLGTDGGISICRFDAGRKSVTNLTRKDGLTDEIVRVILPDISGKSWIGTHDEGILLYEPSSNSFRPLVENWTYGPVIDLLLVQKSELIISTENNGSFRFNLKTNSLRPCSPIVGDKQVNNQDVLTDVEGGLWLLSDHDGLFRANLRVLTYDIPNRDVQALLVSKKGQLWAGTNNGLLTLSNSGNIIDHPLAEGLNIVSLYEDQYNNLWLGTFGDGVYIINPESKIRSHLGEAEGLLNGSILSIDGQLDHLWLASLGGVTEILIEEDPLRARPTSFSKISGLKTDFVYQIHVESPNRIWFATDGEGLALLNHGNISHLQQTETANKEQVDLRRIYSLASNVGTSIWLNTASEGLFELTKDTLYRRGLSKSLSGKSINALAPINDSKLIISHTEGLALLNLTSSDYQHIYQIRSNEATLQPILNAVAFSNQDEAWFGCSGGILHYQDFSENTVEKPRVVVRSASVYPSAEPEPIGKTFHYNENTLAFRFHGLWYTAPDKIRYRYQLEGYDPGWINTRNQSVIYSKLRPGTYTFKVAVSTNKDWSSAVVREFPFSIASPFWQRWWFILLIIISIGSISGYLIRRHDQRLRRTSSLQKQRIESQYEMLKSQINPHFLFNSFNTLIAIIEESPTDAVSYTEKLSDLFRNVLQYRNQETIPLPEEIKLLSDYLFLLEKRFGDKLLVVIDLPDTSELIVPLSLQLLVENAIKHNVVSFQKPLRVMINLSTDGEYICVTNPIQTKLRKEPSTGFGLESLSQRYKLLSNRKIIVEGTEKSFRVCIPLIHSSAKVNQ